MRAPPSVSAALLSVRQFDALANRKRSLTMMLRRGKIVGF